MKKRSAILLILLALPSFQEVEEPLKGYFLVAFDNGGTEGKQPHLVRGDSYRYPEKDVPLEAAEAEDPARTVAFGDPVIFRIKGLNPQAKYKLRMTFLCDSGERIMTLIAGGQVLRDRLELLKARKLVLLEELPAQAYAEGILELELKRQSGPNAVVSAIELWSTDKELRYLELEATSDLRGRIEGRTRNAAGKAVRGAEVRIVLEGGEDGIALRTDEAGAFSFSVPKAWQKYPKKNLSVTAVFDDLGDEKILAMENVYLEWPRLTPRPREDPLDLAGTWKFHTNPPEDFWKSGRTGDDGWEEILVPGEWVMQGFEVAKGGAAGYLRAFEVPHHWRGKRIKLRCDGVYSLAKVWINGHEAGGHEGGFTPFELDVTDFVRPGEDNFIALSVTSESLADRLASATFYAAHPPGGITRKIQLFPVPEVNIASLHVATLFDEDYRDAVMRVQVKIANEGVERIKDLALLFHLSEPEGKEVRIDPNRVDLHAPLPGGSEDHRIDIFVSEPKKWDAEHPDCYGLCCRLQAAGEEETVEKRIGFRQVEVRGCELFVNNRPVKLRGVNRHEAHPVRGRSLTSALWRRDAELYRDANVNYIRTSHYPPAEEFLDACDELGLFVEAEAPICWVGREYGGVLEPGTDDNAFKFRPDIVRPVLEMVERDRSHPCILFWSLANESVWGPNFETAAKMVRAMDPSRPRKFNYAERHGSPNRGECEIGSYHYPGPKGLKDFDDHFRPVVFDEYCHLNTYNRREIAADPGVRDFFGQALAPMWEKMREVRACLGGAIWSGIDDVFLLPSGKVTGYGEWGPIDGWRRPKPEYWHIKKVYSPVRVLDKKVDLPAKGAPIRLRVHNRHDFTSMREIRITWSLGKESGTAAADIPPRTEGELSIPLARTPKEGSVLSLMFHSPRGFLIDAYALPVGEGDAALDKAKGRAEGPLELEEDPEVFIIAGDDFCFEIDRASGRIRKGRLKVKDFIRGGPHLMLLPLSSGPCRPDFDPEVEPLNHTCQNWTARSVSASRKDAFVEVRVSGAYEEADGEYTMRFDGGGNLIVEYSFIVREAVNPRQWGVVFDLDASLDIQAWERRAQWSLYPEDHIGRPKGRARARGFTAKFREEPTWPWSRDGHVLGSNAFRATLSGILWMSLESDDGAGVMVRSDGTQSARAWLEGHGVRLLVAGFDTGGGDIFLATHYAADRRPLKKGSMIAGGAYLEFVRPE